MSVTELREITGLQKENHPATQLHAHRISKDSRQRDQLFSSKTRSCDLFSSPATNSPFLLNIATGKVANAETQEYLLESISAGNQLRRKFQEVLIKKGF